MRLGESTVVKPESLKMDWREKSPRSPTAAGLGRFHLRDVCFWDPQAKLPVKKGNFLIQYCLSLLGPLSMGVVLFGFGFVRQFIKPFARRAEVNAKVRLGKSGTQQISPFCPCQLTKGKSSSHGQKT